MDAKKVFAIIIGVAVLAAGIGFLVTSNVFGEKNQARYNFEEVGYANSFTYHVDGIELTAYADTNSMFEIVKVTLCNDSYGPGISIPTIVWELTMDRITFALSEQTLKHDDFWTCSVEKGRTWGFTIVFEIPEDSPTFVHDASNMQLNFIKIPTSGETLHMKYDGNLHLPDGEMLIQNIDLSAVALRFRFLF